MRKSFIVISLLLLASCCLAAGKAPEPRIKTGDHDLDRALMEMEKKALTPEGAKEVRGIIMEDHGLTRRQVESLQRRGYTLGEVYYFGLMARQSNRRVNDVAALRAQGLGWGVMAQRLKVRPAELNRLRVRLRKIRQEAVRHQIKEKERLRIHSPEPPRPKPKPAPRVGGGRRR